jgi:hypothetical protein
VLVTVTIGALGLLVALALTGRAAAGFRAAGAAVFAAAAALLILFPWSLELVLPGVEWSVLGAGPRPANAHGVADLVLFRTGPVGAGLLGAGMLAAAVLPLAVAQGWRFSWAARAWIVAAVSWAATWVMTSGLLPVPALEVEAALAPAAAAVAMAVSLGMVAFDVDLPGFHFGWRQLVAVLAAGAGLVGALPVLGASFDGRWNAPSRDHSRLLSWMPEMESEGAFRVLWLGDPEVVPPGSWRLEEGLHYATTRNGAGDVRAQWAPAPGRAGLVGDALEVARDGETARLGRLLAPMAIRYVVVPRQLAPGSQVLRRLPPADVVETLRSQIDLREVETDDAVVLYENDAWAPGRATLAPGAVEVSRASGIEAFRAGDIAGSEPVLGEQTGATTYEGSVSAGSEVHLAESSSGRWRLTAEGDTASRRTSFGWANAFSVESAGDATLAFRTPLARWLALALELILIAAAIRLSFGPREVEQP